MRDFQFPSRSAVICANAAAATSHPRATLAAVEMLRAGGTAADAAVAAGAVLTVVEPQMTSIGGDCFVIVHDPEDGLDCISGAGRSAKTLDVAKLRAEGLADIAHDSIHAVTVPGAVAAWDRLLERHGRFGFDKVLASAIECAEGGTPVSPRTGADWKKAEAELSRHTGARHYLPGGKAPEVGDMMTYPALARTFREIASKGRDGFYKGRVADDILAMLQAEGSALTQEDFASAQAVPVVPVSRRYQGVDVLGFPPSNQGLAVPLILGMMERHGPWQGDPLDPRRLHVYLEAVRRAYAVRNRHIADPDFMELSAEDLVSDTTVDRLAATIDPERVAPFDAVADLTGSHTIYLTVVDSEGRAVSFINSLFFAFGSMRAGPESGVLLQNRGHGFNMIEGHPNCIAPGKRPMHTLIPGMVLKDGLPLLSYGVMGGAYQAAGHAYVLSHILDYGMDPQSALDVPRVFLANVAAPGTSVVEAETRIPAEVVAALKGMGHTVVPAAGPIGGGQVIRIDRERGVLIAGSEPRKDGQALGY